LKSEKEVKEFLEELQKQGYNRHSVNMQYEWSGAVDALKWVLEEKLLKPILGRR